MHDIDVIEIEIGITEELIEKVFYEHVTTFLCLNLVFIAKRNIIELYQNYQIESHFRQRSKIDK